MELYHFHESTGSLSVGGGKLKISAQVPNDNANIPGEVYAVQKFRTSFTPSP
jgi:hypothetical protein